MKILTVGASGATGIRLVEELLNRGHHVKAIVRSPNSLPDNVRNHTALDLIQASVLELSDKELERLVAGCHAVASCLGHNQTFNGLFGKPRRLVTEATRRLCMAIKANDPAASTKFVRMNTVANHDICRIPEKWPGWFEYGFYTLGGNNSARILVSPGKHDITNKI